MPERLTFSRQNLSALLRTCLAAGLVSACTQYVHTPEAPLNRPEPVAMAELDAVLARITPPRLGDGTEHESHPSPSSRVDLLRAGDDLGYGVTMTPEAETLWAATNYKDWQTWEAKYDEAKRSLPDTPEAAFLLSAQRLRAMMHSGRIDEVNVELKRLEEIERGLFGNVLETTSQYAQLNSWLNNSYDSVAYNAAVVDAIGDWWLPEFYYAKPENTGNAKRVAGALMRSHIGLTCEHIVLHEYETSMAWGRAGLDMTESVLGISHHPIYGLFVKTTTYMYEGQAWMMACYAAARIGVSRDLEANQYLIDRAKEFFRQAQYRWGDYLVDSIIDYVLYDTGMKPKLTEQIGELGAPDLVTPARLSRLVRFRPDDLQVRESVALPVPEPDSIKLPGEGALNAYDITVSPELAAANEAILAGDYDMAIRRYDRIAATETDPLKLWHAAEQAVKTLILAGRSAEAEERIARLEKLEMAHFNSNISARALRGEIRFWLGDNDGAVRDFLQVVEMLGDFRPPSLLVFKPEVAQMALLTRAQYLAYLGIARSLIFAGDPRAALPWAEAGEQLFEEAHYTWQHQLYRRYLKLDADMFYARGVNLAVLAGARLAKDGDLAAAEELMATARAYLDAMGFDAGLVTIEATWARALLDIGENERAERVAREAAALATERAQTDLLWQVQALRGEALTNLGRERDAEDALRAAQAAVESVSGALASDASKRQFGIGKDEITRRLVGFGMARGDHAQVFADLERGRARAFVDMLGEVRFSGQRQSAQAERIREVDALIRNERLRASLPGLRGANSLGKINSLESRRAALISRLRGQDPELADALSIANRSLRDVQRKLGKGDLLLYTLPVASTDQAIRFLAIQPTGTEVIETGLSHDRLGELLTAFTTDDPIGSTLKQREAAEAIFAGLGMDGWAPERTLYVVPSQSLYFVPWGALPVETPAVILPNGGWLTRTPPRVASGSAAVIGSPDLGIAWESLPGAAQEAETIAGLYKTAPLTGSEASEANLRSRVGKGVGVLHLATHGLFDARDPLQSSILLSDASEANRLTASDLFQNPLPASLVVLSACETGLGQVSAGDDFLGLARSFYLGGARAVMNSLWPVHDKPTQLFMETFHRKARDGDIGKAWLAARNALREADFPPSVYGAFVLGGADRI